MRSREQYLELLSTNEIRDKTTVNIKAFSIFIAEAPAIGTPAIVSREIAGNLEVQIKPFSDSLVLAEKALIRPWDEIALAHAKKLYET